MSILLSPLLGLLRFLSHVLPGCAFRLLAGWGVDAHHTFSNLLPRFRTDELNPTKKGGRVRNSRSCEATKPTQQRTRTDLLFGLFKAPIEKLFEVKQTYDHF